MNAKPFLTENETKAFRKIWARRDDPQADRNQAYADVDSLLAKAFERNLGIKRYMVLRLSGSRGCMEIQARHFEGCPIPGLPHFIAIAGPMVTRQGGLGRKKLDYEMVGEVTIERRLLDGTWVPLSVYRGR